MKHPNIVYILADDMGYGDVRHLNPDCQFPTPHLDRLGREGVTFTDAHASSAVCTPSRYSILTGRYCWRTPLKKHVLSGVSGPLIEPGQSTVASVLRRSGYRTACIGKWHVGWNWAVKEGHEPARHDWSGEHQEWIDFEKPISEGPLSCGFDSFYGISGSLDMPPYVYVDNDRPVETPAAWGTAGEFLREGRRMEGLRANRVLEHLIQKSVEFIAEQSEETPFFLYFPITAPHTPIAPAPEFAGISGINPYADFCMEVDARVGQILDALEARGLAENTVVIFTSDNGASAAPSECATLEKHYGHYCSYRYRGYKSDIWDGGHRVPFLVRWPAGARAGIECAERIGIFDLFATALEWTGQTPGERDGVDSLSFLPALQGKPIDIARRPCLSHRSIDGMFAIRKGRWKLCRCPGSGGWTLPDEEARTQQLPEIQLYDMEADVGEQHNRAAEHPEIVEELTRELHRALVRGRTTAGPKLDSNCPDSFEDWQQVNWLSEIPERFILDD